MSQRIFRLNAFHQKVSQGKIWKLFFLVSIYFGSTVYLLIYSQTLFEGLFYQLAVLQWPCIFLRLKSLVCEIIMKIAVKNWETPWTNISSTTQLILACTNRDLRLDLSFTRGIVFVLQNEYYYVACLPIYGHKNNRPFATIAEKDNRIVFK